MLPFFMLSLVSSLTCTDLEALAPTYSLGDYDQDGLVDVYVVHPGGSDVLFRNLGDGSFEDVTAAVGLAGDRGSRDALWEDFDGDGKLDLYVSSYARTSKLYQNTGTSFVDVSAAAGFVHGAEQDAEWLDFDQDQRMDLWVATAFGDRLYRNEAHGRFELVPLVEVSETVVSSETAVSAEAAPAAASEADEAGSATRAGAASSRSGRAGGLRLPPRTSRPSRTTRGSGSSAASAPTGIGLPVTACALKLRDVVAGTCSIEASTTPALGRLYPLSTDFNVSPSGYVGIGTATPSSRLHVAGSGWLGGAAVFESTDHESAVLIRGSNASGVVNVARAELIDTADASNSAYLAVTGSQGGAAGDLRFVTGGITGAGSAERMRITKSGNVGIGTTTPGAHLEVKGIGFNGGAGWFESTDDGNSVNVVGRDGVGVHDTAFVYFADAGPAAKRAFVGLTGSAAPGAAGSLRFGVGVSGQPEWMRIQSDGNVGIGTATPTEKLDVAGVVKGYCVTITGGCDLAEPFETVEAHVEPGMVVCIDPEREGELTRSKRAYDTTVVGVISGAGGVKTGMTMSQTGVLDEGAPVALTGRVYAWCDASYGAIKPGDLLTSSDTPGHAMKVTDRTQAAGAMLGKAMSSLDSGKGLVLIVVALQ